MLRIIIAIVIALMAMTNSAHAGGTVSVRGYYRADGTYVRPHTRSAPSRSGGVYVPSAPSAPKPASGATTYQILKEMHGTESVESTPSTTSSSSGAYVAVPTYVSTAQESKSFKVYVYYKGQAIVDKTSSDRCGFENVRSSNPEEEAARKCQTNLANYAFKAGMSVEDARKFVDIALKEDYCIKTDESLTCRIPENFRTL